MMGLIQCKLQMQLLEEEDKTAIIQEIQILLSTVVNMCKKLSGNKSFEKQCGDFPVGHAILVFSCIIQNSDAVVLKECWTGKTEFTVMRRGEDHHFSHDGSSP